MNKLSSRYTEFLIAIDPGRENGICIWNPLEMDIKMKTCDFWDTIRELTNILKFCRSFSHKMIVVIEDVTQNKPVFQILWPPKDVKIDRVSYVGKIAQNVGMNKRTCELIIQFCKNYSIEVKRIVPGKKNQKIRGRDFHRLTGIERSNEHTRDAVMLLIRNGYLKKV